MTQRGALPRPSSKSRPPDANLQAMTPPDQAPSQITVHALQIGDRINTAGFEGEVLSGTPLAVRVGQAGLAVVFRYGAVVFLGLTADQEAEFLERLKTLAQEKLTVIISTHRLSLLSFVDRLLLFERGRLIADGPRDKVIAMLQGGPRTAPAPGQE